MDGNSSDLLLAHFVDMSPGALHVPRDPELLPLAAGSASPEKDALGLDGSAHRRRDVGAQSSHNAPTGAFKAPGPSHSTKDHILRDRPLGLDDCLDIGLQ